MREAGPRRAAAPAHPRGARRGRAARAARRSCCSTAAAGRPSSPAAPAATPGTARTATSRWSSTARSGRLGCHHCGHAEPVPESLPGVRLGDARPPRRRAPSGSRPLLAELLAPLPVFRLDSDSAAGRGRPRRDPRPRSSGAERGVLVGTQMVAKGHDFPDVDAERRPRRRRDAALPRLPRRGAHLRAGRPARRPQRPRRGAAAGCSSRRWRPTRRAIVARRAPRRRRLPRRRARAPPRARATRRSRT